MTSTETTLQSHNILHTGLEFFALAIGGLILFDLTRRAFRKSAEAAKGTHLD